MTPKSPTPSGTRRARGSAAREAAPSPSRLIDQRIRELGGWRGDTLARMRGLIRAVDPSIEEEWKWNVPVWSRDGIICTGEAYKQVVKLTFAKGASLPDPACLFNASLEGNTRRAIDLREGERVNARAFRALVKAAVAENVRARRSKAKAESNVRVTSPAARRKDATVTLLSGGNPQIAKGDGDTPVQAYIAAMPGWKRELGRRLDSLITRTVPGVRKAVKWNSPFYGMAGQGWFLSFHVFTHYVKVTFFRGTALRPVPPGGTHADGRWIDIRETDALDERQLTAWMRQAASIPGWGK